MTQQSATFAIPGDITTLTGGYIYERRLLEGLRAAGHDVTHLQLGASYPDPTPDEMTEAVDALCAVDPNRVLILDGFVSGATETSGLAGVRAPMVAMVHHPLAMESGLSDVRREHLFKTERDNLALVEHVLVPSPHTASMLTDHYGVAADRITIARPGTNRPGGVPSPIDPPLILSVGLLHPRKGHDILLHALARLKDVDWQAVIVGSDHDTGHAAQLIDLQQSLGLGGRVRFAGKVPQDQLEPLYRQASIFALATRYEGYGIVFDEALAHGLPIVSCKTGAVPDTVPDDAGVLVPVDDIDGFSHALGRLLSDQSKRRDFAKAAQRAGLSLPDWSETARIASGVLNRLG